MSFTLTTDRLLLQVEDGSKAPLVLAFYERNRRLFEQYEPTRPKNFYTLAYQKASMNYEYNEIVKGHCLRYYVYLKENPSVLIGSIVFSHIEHGAFQTTSLGYKFDIAYQRKGYATESCQAAIPILFTNYRLHRIEARVAPDNLPSIRLLERLGFTYEGIEYSSVEVNGTFQDHYRYGLISTIQ